MQKESGKAAADNARPHHVIDVTGEYADFVLDHDRIVPGRIPMVMHQYKLSGGWPVDAHIIEVDMPINRQPQLIVYDVSRTMGTWHRGVLAISDALLGYMTGRENTTTWLFLNLDPYFYEKQDDETSWKVLEHFVKQQGQTVKPVFTSQKFSADTISQRLHVDEAASQGATIQSESKADTSADYVVDDRCVIPAEIKAMSKEKLTEKIAEYEKTQKSLKNNEAEIKLPIHIV